MFRKSRIKLNGGSKCLLGSVVRNIFVSCGVWKNETVGEDLGDFGQSSCVGTVVMWLFGKTGRKSRIKLNGGSKCLFGSFVRNIFVSCGVLEK